MEEKKSLSVIDQAREKFELACKDAQALQIVNNFGAAFVAVGVVNLLREAMSDTVMDEVFMPLMNTKVGFLTDRTGKADSRGNIKPLYSRDVVRDCIIDAVSIGLLPTGNQMNILADRMYPTKEGYTYLLKKLGCKYFINIGAPKISEQYADVPCKISYEYKSEKKTFEIVANVKKDSYSSIDQIKGKAERRAKKLLYEYLTGIDLGDGDETSTIEDADYTDVTHEVKEEIRVSANKEEIKIDIKEPIGKQETPNWMK